MPSTIRDLTELTTPATDDYFLVSDTSDVTNRDKRISQANLLGFAPSDIGRLSVAQTNTALKTFSAGINLGQSTFNYFEQGAWTPALTFGGLATGIIHAFQVGRYLRINNFVHIWGAITLSNKGSAVGSAAVGGLPFATTPITGMRYTITLYIANITYVGVIQGRLSTSAVTSFTVEQVTEAGALTTLTNTNFANNSNLEFNFDYLIS